MAKIKTADDGGEHPRGAQAFAREIGEVRRHQADGDFDGGVVDFRFDPANEFAED